MLFKCKIFINHLYEIMKKNVTMKKNLSICFATLAIIILLTTCRRNEKFPKPTINNRHGKELSSAPASYACFVITNVFSNQVLEVRNDSTLLYPQNYNVQQDTAGNTALGINGHQKWYLIQQSTGAITGSTPFKIMNVENGLYLEAPNNISGTQLWVDHSNSSSAEIWFLQQVPGQDYYVIKNANGLVLTDHSLTPDIITPSLLPGAPITEESLTNSTGQNWTLTSIQSEAYRDDNVVTFFHRGNVPNTTVAFDQGNSIPLTSGPNKGKVLWIAEDSFASNELQPNGQLYCWFFEYHNSALLQPSINNWDSASTPNITTTSNASTGVNELEIIKSPGIHDQTFSWPGVGVEIGNNVVLYTYESANDSLPPNQVLNIIQEKSGTTWGNVTRITPSGLSGQTTIDYAVGMIKNPTNDTVYCYGAEGTSFNANSIFLARYPANNPSLWSFWTGHNWASKPDLTSSLSGQLTIGSGTSVQSNCNISYVNGKYVMMQMDLGFVCNPSPHCIYISTATSPFGPFTAPKKVYTIQDTYHGNLARFYTACIHGEFVNGKNELLVTYCLNYSSCSTQTCFNNNLDPNFYQVKGVRIPYSTIGL